LLDKYLGLLRARRFQQHDEKQLHYAARYRHAEKKLISLVQQAHRI
jgi:hypothetical protein